MGNQKCTSIFRLRVAVCFILFYLSCNSCLEYENSSFRKIRIARSPPSLIKLRHTGAYVAQFKVEWDEVTIDALGHEQVERKGWDGNWKDVTAGFNTEIHIPGNARNVDVYARECTGLAWEWWRTVFDRKNIQIWPELTFSIWGTTLNPKYEINPPF